MWAAKTPRRCCVSIDAANGRSSFGSPMRRPPRGDSTRDSITRAITLNERQFKRLWRLDLKLIIDKEPKVVWKTGKRRMKEGERIAMKFLVNRISVWAVHE